MHIINTDFKHISVHETFVEIVHFIGKELHDEINDWVLEDEPVKPDILEDYFDQKRISYELCENFGWCDISSLVQNEKIVITMPRYTPLLEIEIEPIKLLVKLKELFHLMRNQGIYHRDMAPRNIGVDDTGNLQLLDLGDVKELNTNEPFLRQILLNFSNFDCLSEPQIAELELYVKNLYSNELNEL